MTAEGWDGRSIRQHVENVASVAAEAMETAECAKAETLVAAAEASRALHDIAGIRDELAELAKAVNATQLEGGEAVRRAGLFQKVTFIRSEIAAWHHFMVEAQGVRGALQEWRRLDLGLKGARE